MNIKKSIFNIKNKNKICQVTEWEKTLSIHISNKGLISMKYKDL